MPVAGYGTVDIVRVEDEVSGTTRDRADSDVAQQATEGLGEGVTGVGANRQGGRGGVIQGGLRAFE